MVNPWTNENIDTLKNLWAEGHSTSRIGNILGTTKNAVIGKIHRLGLKLRVMGVNPLQRARVEAGRSRVMERKTPPMCNPVEPVLPSISKPTPRVLTIDELTMSTCRWPIGDPGQTGFGYCGCTVQKVGAPYCQEHIDIAYYNPKTGNYRKHRFMPQQFRTVEAAKPSNTDVHL